MLLTFVLIVIIDYVDRDFFGVHTSVYHKQHKGPFNEWLRLLCRQGEPCLPIDLVRVKTIIEVIKEPYVSFKEPSPNKSNANRIFEQLSAVPHLPTFFRSIVEILRYSALPNGHCCFLDKTRSLDQAGLVPPL